MLLKVVTPERSLNPHYFSAPLLSTITVSLKISTGIHCPVAELFPNANMVSPSTEAEVTTAAMVGVMQVDFGEHCKRYEDFPLSAPKRRQEKA